MMLLTNWLKNLFRTRNHLTRRTCHRRRLQARKYSPGRAQAAESLENRVLLAADFTWNAVAAGNWSDAANWTYTGSDADGLPDADDNVTFDNTSDFNALIDGNFSVKSLTISGDYDGTVSLDTNTFTVQSGDFDIDTASQFSADTGTVAFTGNGRTVSVGAAIFNDVRIEVGSNQNITFANTLDVNGDLQIGQDGVNYGFFGSINGTIQVAGDVFSSDTDMAGSGDAIILDGTGTQVVRGNSASNSGQFIGLKFNKASGTVELENTIQVGSGGWDNSAHNVVDAGSSTVEFVQGSLNVDAGEQHFNDLRIQIYVNYNINFVGDTYVDGDFEIGKENTNYGFFGSINGGPIHVRGDLYSADTDAGGGGSAAIILDGTDDQIVRGYSANNTGQFTGLTFNKASGTVFLENTIQIANGGWDNSAGNTINAGSSTVQFVQGSLNVDTGGEHFHNMGIYIGANRNINFVGNTYVDGDFEIGEASTNYGFFGSINGGPIRVRGNVSSSDTNAAGGGTAEIIMEGTDSQLISTSLAGYGYLPDLIINKGTWEDVDVSGNLRINGDLTIDRVHSLLGTGTIDVSNDVHANDSKVGGTATVRLSGANDIDGGGQLANLLIAGGTTTLYGNLGVQGFEITDGTFLAGPSTLSVATYFTSTGGTFDAGTGTVRFTGSNEYTLSSASQHFNNVIFAMGSWARRNVDGTMYVDGNLGMQYSNTSMVNSGTILVGGNVDTTTSGRGDATIKLEGTHSITTGGGDGSLPKLLIAGGQTDASGSGVLTVSSFEITDGEFIAPNLLKVAGDVTATGGVFTAGSGTVEIIDDSTVDTEGFLTFNNLTVNMGSWDHLDVVNTADINGNLVIGGSVNSSFTSGTLKVAGDVTTTNSGFGGAGTVFFDGAGDQHLNTGGGVGQIPNVEINKPGGTLFLEDTVEITGDWVHVSGAVDAGTSTIVFQGNDTIVDAASMTFNNIELQKSNWGDLTVVGDLDLDGDLTLNGSNNSDLKVFTGTVNVQGDLTINQIRNLNGNSIRVRGDVTTSDMSVGGSGTIVMVGGDTHLIATTSNARVTNLTIQKGTYDDVDVSGTVDVNGDFTIIGVGVITGDTIKVLGDVVTTDTGVGGHADILLTGNHTINAGGQTGELPDLVIAGGLTDASNSGVLGVQDFTISGGTFSTPHVMEVAGDFTSTGGVFDVNSEVIFVGGDSTIDASGVTFDDVTINKSGYGDLTIVGVMDVDGLLTITGATTSNLQGGTLAASGDVTTTNPGFGGSGTILFDGTSDQTLGADGGTGQLPNVEINKSGGTLFIQDTIETVGNWTHTAGAVDHTGTLVFQGGDTTVDASTMTFDNVIVAKGGTYDDLTVIGSMNVGGDFSITGAHGIWDGTVYVTGDVVTTDTSVGGDATIELNATGGSHTINAGGQTGDLPNLRIAGGTTDASNSGTLGVQDFTLSAGTFQVPAMMEVAGDFTSTGGTYDLGASTSEVKFIGGDATVDASSVTFDEVTINKSGYGDLTIAGTMDVNGLLTITGATTSKLQGGTLQAGGDVTTTNPGFGGSGTILFDGTSDQTLGADGGTGQIPNVEINKSGGTLFIQDTIETVGNWTHTAGAVVHTGTLVFQGGDTTVNASGMTFDNVILAKGGTYDDLTVTGSMNVGGDFSITGAHGIWGGAVNVAGDVSSSDTSVGGTSQIVMNGSGDASLTSIGGGKFSGGGIQIDKTDSADTVAMNSNVDVRAMDVTSGVLDLGGNVLTVSNSGDMTVDSAGTVVFDVDANTPPLAPNVQLVVQGTLTFEAGSTVSINVANLGASTVIADLAIADEIINLPTHVEVNGAAAFVDVVTSGANEILQLTLVPLQPIIVSGGGAYVLQLEDLDTLDTNDDEIVLYRNGLEVARQAYLATSYVDITGAVDSSDSLTIDFDGGSPVMPGLGSDGGNPIPVDGVFFDGLGGAGSDTLTLEGGAFDTVTYNYDNAHDGDIELVDGAVTSTVNYVGLEPITFTGTATNAVFNLTGGDDLATLTDNGTSSSLTGSSFENTTFTNPTGSLTINGGGGADEFHIGGDYAVGLDLTIDVESIYLSSDLTVNSFTSTGQYFDTQSFVGIDILATAGNIDITTSGGIDISGRLDAQNSGGPAGEILLNAGSGGVSIGDSVTTDGGQFVSSGGSDLTIGAEVNTGTGVIILNHAGGDVIIDGDVTAGALESYGVEFSMAVGSSITVSGTYNNFGINLQHTGSINLSDTDLVSTGVQAHINLRAGAGTQDISLNSVTTSDGGIYTIGGDQLTLNADLTVGGPNNTLDLEHGGAVYLGDHDITGASSLNISGQTINSLSGSLLSASSMLTLNSTGGAINIWDVTAAGSFTAITASIITVNGTLDIGAYGEVQGTMIVGPSGGLVFNLIADDYFSQLIVMGSLLLSPGNTVTLDVGNDNSLTDDSHNPSFSPPPTPPLPAKVPITLAMVLGGAVVEDISTVILEGDIGETDKIDAVFSNPSGIFIEF